MKPWSSTLLLFLVLTTAAYAHQKTSDLYDIKITKVKEGIYLASRPEPLRPFVEGNVTIIINEHDVVLVDAGGAPSSARRVIAELKKLTPNPVSCIVYTHIHRDHRFGTQEYVKAFPGVEIISHPDIREVIDTNGETFVANTIRRIESQRADGVKEIQRLREENLPGNDKIIAHLRRFYEQDINTILKEYRSITNIPPTLTFERKLVLYRGKRTIELLFLGKGDTADNVVIYLPKDKLVCAGDMVVHPIPYGFSDQPSEWITTLGKLSELDFDTLIPGHGDVQIGKTYVQRLAGMLRSVQTQVKAGIDAGLDLESVRKRVDLSEVEKQFAGADPVYRYYFQEYFATPNVERTFKELKTKTTTQSRNVDAAPQIQPEVFGPGVLSVGEVFRGTFTPDGQTFYFFKKVTKDEEDYRVFRSRLVDGKWTEPQRVNLGGEYSDLYPSISSDGSRMVFTSYRPAPGDSSAKRNAYLWYVDREGDGWGKPVFISAANVFGSYHSGPQLEAGGTIIFRRVAPDWRTSETLITRWTGVEYTKPEPFQAGEQWKGWRPDIHIAGGLPGPDGNVLFLDVVYIDPKTQRRSKSDIWISAKREGKWSEPQALGPTINTDGWETFPFFSPDGKTLYFVRDFSTFYSISLADALRSVK